MPGRCERCGSAIAGALSVLLDSAAPASPAPGFCALAPPLNMPDNIGKVMSTAKTDDKGVVVVCANCGQRNRIQYERLNQAVRCGKCKSDIRGVNTPVDVDSEDHFATLIKLSPLPVLVDFWAPWCGPCKMVAPEFEKVAADSVGDLIVAKVNTEEQPSLAQRFAIQAIPTLVLFQGGRETARTSGARPAAGIQDFVHQSLGAARVG